MANINSNPSHRANLGKNGFDVGKNSFFTSAPGMLLPTYWDFLNPGDKVKYGVDQFTRTVTLSAPPFMKLRQVVRWFFVPIEQLYSPFGSMFYGINDVNSTMFATNNLNTNIPTVKTDDLGTVISNYVTGTNQDAFGYDVLLGANRLAEFFHYGFHLTDLNANTNLYRINPLLACAYQKIYFDKFRLSNRENLDRGAYNLDTYYSTGDVASQVFFGQMMKIRYAHYDKDYFINNEVAPLIDGGSIGMLNSASLADINQWLNNDFTSGVSLGEPRIIGDKNVVGHTPNTGATVNNLNLQYSFANVLSTSNIRSMFAIEKLAEITRRAAKHYDAQTLAHFGFDVPKGISGEVYELGSFVNNIQVSDVAATADSGGSIVGDLSGRGNGFASGKNNSFVAPCHGILMAISYSIPDTTYNAVGILARENVYRSRVDFYQPEFDRLGMQPLFAYESNFDPNAPATTNNAINGWHYRYQELKQKPNVSYGDFNQTRYPWVAKRLVNPNSTNLSQYLVSPNYLDNQVSNVFNGTFPYDPLMSWHDYKVYKSSVMSTYGLPSL